MTARDRDWPGLADLGECELPHLAEALGRQRLPDRRLQHLADAGVVAAEQRAGSLVPFRARSEPHPMNATLSPFQASRPISAPPASLPSGRLARARSRRRHRLRAGRRFADRPHLLQTMNSGAIVRLSW